MVDEPTAARAAAVLAVLADRNRLRILGALAEGEAGVGDLRARLGLPQPLTSFHLLKLHRAADAPTRWSGRRSLR
jgi:DNA-binding transcriptional ArsR family regulator